MKIHGQCHCGAIRFEAEVDPAKVVACHCSDCQTMSGAPFRAVVQVAAADLAVQGIPKQYVKVAESGNRRVQAFCGECGTPIYATAAENPSFYGLRLGCVAERAQLPPQRQIWTRSAMPWLHDLDAVPRTELQTPPKP